ncbi:MAG: FtsX-like permease family protein, partial [Dehalococcoidia bacterium]
EDESMHYYIPLARAPYPWPPRGLLVRTSSPEIFAPVVRRRLRDALPAVRLVSATPYTEVIDPQYRSWELGSRLFAAFGGLAVLVASLGLFSVLAFDVAERRPELGVRAALGATRLRMLTHVLGDGLRLSIAGVLIGTSAALIAGRRAEDLLFGVSPREPLVLAGVALVTLVVAIIASGLPAWRAARVGPNEALRCCCSGSCPA